MEHFQFYQPREFPLCDLPFLAPCQFSKWNVNVHLLYALSKKGLWILFYVICCKYFLQSVLCLHSVFFVGISKCYIYIQIHWLLRDVLHEFLNLETAPFIERCYKGSLLCSSSLRSDLLFYVDFLNLPEFTWVEHGERWQDPAMLVGNPSPPHLSF